MAFDDVPQIAKIAPSSPLSQANLAIRTLVVAAADLPIGPEERDDLLRDVRLPVAVAVSGGADSMALMWLVATWVKANVRTAETRSGAPPVLVVTVDHGLRPESGSEARWVGGQANRLGLSHVVLTWTGPKPRTGLQEAAREARYSLILDLIGSEDLAKPRDVLLAHHLEDQAETMLMRLARGSGVDGLGAMRELETRTWIRLRHPVEERSVILWRPLLSVPKGRLAATLAAHGLDHLSDPSNEDRRHERVRLRQALAERHALGLDDRVLAISARRLAQARNALEVEQYRLAREALRLHDGAWASLDGDRFLAAPRELALRVLRSLIAGFGGQANPVERDRLEALLDALGSRPVRARTLGGSMIGRTSRGEIFLHREPWRRRPPPVEIRPGEGLFWDRRFYVSVAPRAGFPVRIEPMAASVFARLKRDFPAVEALKVPAHAAATLPSLWHGERLLAVPHLNRAVPGLGGPANEDEAVVQVRFADQHVRSIFGTVT